MSGPPVAGSEESGWGKGLPAEQKSLTAAMKDLTDEFGAVLVYGIGGLLEFGGCLRMPQHVVV